MRRLLGLRALVHDAIDAITNLVEETHEGVARKPVAFFSKPGALLSVVEPLGAVAREIDGVRRGVAQRTFDSVRGTNRAVQALGDRSIALATRAVRAVSTLDGAPLDGREASGLDELSAAPSALDDWVERAESALNGVVGDFLELQGNPLATGMRLRHRGRALKLGRAELRAALPAATDKVVVFVHGLASSDSVWIPNAGSSSSDSAQAPVNFGDQLARSLGYTALCLRYNSGLHVSDNGRQLARLLAELHAAYPVDIERIALVGHSMGGLVAQSAVHHADGLGEAWLAQLQHVLSIGTPHFGAPLARAGHIVASLAALFDTAGTQVSAKVLRARSAGIKDLSFGALLDSDWREDWHDVRPEGEVANLFAATRGPDQCRFVEGVAYGSIAARFRPTDTRAAEWIGDLLVHLPSACGRHADPTRHIPFHMGHVVDGVHHVALTTHPAVYRQLERFLVEWPVPK